MSSGLAVVPARMSLDQCAQSCSAAALRESERRAQLALLPPPRRRRRVMPNPSVQSLAAAYRGAAIGQMNQDWVPATLSSDYELRENLRMLRNRARDLRRNNPYVQSFLRLGKINVVGPYGFVTRPQVRDAQGELDRELNKALATGFDRWARSRVTLDRSLNLARALALAWETMFTDGECFVRLILGAPNAAGLALQFIDADLIDEHFERAAAPGQNEIRMGVEVDGNGAPVGYWVNKPASPYSYPTGERYFVPAWDPETGRGEMLHFFLPQRVNQTRGPSLFHPVMETLNQIGALEEAELFASRAGATPLGFIIPGEDAEEPEEDEDQDQEDQAALAASAPDGELPPARAHVTNPREIIPETAAFFRLHKGETLGQWKAEHPNAALPQVMKLMLQAGAVGVGGLYYEMAGDLEGVNFTSSRAGQLSQRDVWRMHQESEIDLLALPIRQAWVRIALLKGTLSVRGRRLLGAVAPYLEVDIRGRGWELVQPLEDSQTSALRIACGLTSRQLVLAEQNESFDDVLEQLKDEDRRSAEAGVSIAPPGSVAADVAASIANNRAKARNPAALGSNGNGDNAEGDKASPAKPSIPALASRGLAFTLEEG